MSGYREVHASFAEHEGSYTLTRCLRLCAACGGPIACGEPMVEIHTGIICLECVSTGSAAMADRLTARAKELEALAPRLWELAGCHWRLPSPAEWTIAKQEAERKQRRRAWTLRSILSRVAG